MKLTHPAKNLGKSIVLILGGGFAGLNAARKLADEPDVFVILHRARVETKKIWNTVIPSLMSLPFVDSRAIS